MANTCGALESSAHFTRGGGPAAPDHDADNTSRSIRVKEEQRRLIQWAEIHRKLARSPRLPPEFARGGEHAVYYQERTRRYIKATLIGRQRGYGIALGSYTRGATPSEYLDRMCLQNKIFADDIRLEKIVPNAGEPIIIISQPAIKGTPPLQSALDDLMITKGYENLENGAYYDEPAGLLVFDLFPRNAIQTEDGHIYPIDPVIQRITRDFGQFLREQPHTINLY